MSDDHRIDDPGLGFLRGGGEMGALIRAHDWASTPIGPFEQWPQSLRTTLGILLNSRYPMFVFWGPHLIKIYNDAYRPITGAKHPWALGRPAAEVWPEIWGDIAPLVERALAGDATWSDDLGLFMHRSGFTEETYFTFSYSPIRDESGGVGGMFCACMETTGRVLADRRQRTLRDLAARPASARSVSEACTRSMEVLGRNPHDLPFALIYLLDDDGTTARLASTVGVLPAHVCDRVQRGTASDYGWPLFTVAHSRQAHLVTDLAPCLTRIPQGPWPEPPNAAMVLPIVDRALDRAAGLVVLGIGSRRTFDDDYRGWFELVAGQIGASIANARASEDERRRSEALAELDRAKTAFFSNVSHEFRTPLTLMLGPLEDLLSRPLEADVRDGLEVLQRNARRLLKLVNTLLDFSRIEAGRLQATWEPVDLAALTADFASAFRSACERAGLRLTVSLPTLSQPVYVDRDMWEQVVTNLLGNAFKYTFEGGIDVSMHERDSHVELAISDTGIGIAEHQLPRIFDRFHRVAGARARTYEGTGIGLALVQQLVRLQGGQVSVRSTLGEGTTFLVSLPLGSAHVPADRLRERGLILASAGQAVLDAVEEASRWLPADPVGGAGDDRIPPIVPAQPALARATRPRVLLADDNADMRDYIGRLLRDRYDVHAVADGVAALEALRGELPDLLITDVMMPNLDGVGLLRELRRDRRTRTLPILVLSARAGEEARVEGLREGADDYLIKPFSARELSARVDALVALDRVRREARLAAERVNQMKDEFLATLSHELRTPLNAILGWSEVLKRDGLPPDDARRGMIAIERNARAQARMIEDLLDMNRIISGKVRLDVQRVNVSEILEQVVQSFAPAAEARGVRLTRVLDTVGGPVIGDPGRLQQVFWNLLSNAIKFTPRAGRVQVVLQRVASHVEARVSDTGEGIEPDFLPYIFERFRQADGSTTRTHGGLGLGLSIVKQLVELHGGSVRASSGGPGKGATFEVLLPIAPTLPETLRDPRSTQFAVETDARDEPLPQLSGARVLVIDDDADSRELLTRTLADADARVVAVATAGEALALLAREPMDLLISDIGMPHTDGYQLIREVRARPATAGGMVPALALTAYARSEDRQHALRAGYHMHLSKPVERGEFLTVCAKLTGRLEKNASAAMTDEG